LAAPTLSRERESPPPLDEESAEMIQPARAALPPAGEVKRLFGQLQVRRSERGNVVIEAPAEAASTLGALFEGMAALLQAVAESEK
jgi:hypothetical protein